VIRDAFTSQDGLYEPTEIMVTAEELNEDQFHRLAAYLFPHRPHGLGRWKHSTTTTVHLYGNFFGVRSPNEAADWLRQERIAHHTEITHRWDPADQDPDADDTDAADRAYATAGQS
jgi:hypothetical protein